MVAERIANLSLQAQDKGFNKIINSAAKNTGLLSESITAASEGFTSLGDSLPTKGLDLLGKSSKVTIGSLGKLDRSMRGTTSTYGTLIDRTEQANSIMEVTDNRLLKLAGGFLGINDKLETANSLLAPAAGFWQKYDRSSTGAGKALTVVSSAGKALNPVLSKTGELSEIGAEKFKEIAVKSASGSYPTSRSAGVTKDGEDVVAISV